MLFTEQGRGLTEEKASRPALPHVWMWTGVTQQDTAQTEAPAPGHGSPRRKLDTGWGAPPAGLCGAMKHRSPPHKCQLAPSHARVTPQDAWPPALAQLDFVEVGGMQVGHGHQHVALGTWQGVAFMESQVAEHHTEKKLKPTLSLSKAPYSSKQIFL